MSISTLSPRFKRLDVTCEPNGTLNEELGVLNPASARLRDGSLVLYPRMVAAGNISQIGLFSVNERDDGSVVCDQRGFVLEPTQPYEIRSEPGGYGCEDPRVTFIPILDLYVMAYVAFGPPGPQVAVAISADGLAWERLGPIHFGTSQRPFADKDAAFFPEPVRSPGGVESIAFYHRPTINISVRDSENSLSFIQKLSPDEREGIAIGYIPLEAVRRDPGNLCACAETHRLKLPPASWGKIKVGAGTPPIRVREGWLSVIHGVDVLSQPSGSTKVRYGAGVVMHDIDRIARILYRSPEPLFVPNEPGELRGTVGQVVFPTAIDPRGPGAFDIYYGMADYQIGRGRMTI